MVYGFILHTVAQKEVHILYYKVYSCYGSLGCEISADTSTKNEINAAEVGENSFSNENSNLSGNAQPKVLFESISDRKELITYISNKVHMHYSLKVKQALVPVTSIENDTKISGIFKERNWKNKFSEDFVVVWQGVRGFGFTILCKKNENLYQAQNILDTIIVQLEKHIKFLSEPLVAVKLIETVALIVNNYIPSGQLVYFNSKMLKAFEKKVEVNLYAK